MLYKVEITHEVSPMCEGQITKTIEVEADSDLALLHKLSQQEALKQDFGESDDCIHHIAITRLD